MKICGKMMWECAYKIVHLPLYVLFLIKKNILIII